MIAKMENILHQHLQKYLLLFCDYTVFHWARVSWSNPFFNLGAVRSSLYHSRYCTDYHCTGLCASVLERSKLLTSCCCCWVAQFCLTLCNPMDCSMPGLPVPHHHLKFVQVHLHCITDAIQPAHPLTLSSPSALSLSWHQGLFQLVSCSHQVTKILAL